ncbi:MAG: hypothetical protein HRU18_03585 [Pseudoalteromonas sp.]|uniref:hypothetical protein n=1 Tax=Pseudoalteromonas sp. TaxID=53249 RepID=UPI001D9C6A66|nr:hypothetical protein [Pseudoalteromonas sp.]NRA77268.1 hypothetical protein [Pseudoalteromonas sp.]
MSKKIEVIEQALVITDTLTSEVLFDAPKSEFYYKVEDLDNDVISLYNINRNRVTIPSKVRLEDSLDKDGIPYTKSSFEDFARENLGFKGAGKTSALSTGEYLIGWQDFADSNTSESNPISQTNSGGGEILLTNNNQGTLTDGNTTYNAETTVKGVNDLWSTTSNTLTFKDTGIEKNDVILIRVHINISSSIIEQDFDVKLDFYDDVDAGGNFVFGFKKQIHTETLSAGVFREKQVDMKFFVGESILNGSGTISLVGTKSFEASVIGWNLTILKVAR